MVPRAVLEERLAAKMLARVKASSGGSYVLYLWDILLMCLLAWLCWWRG